MAQATFDKLRAQAALQWQQLQAGAGAPVDVRADADARRRPWRCCRRRRRRPVLRLRGRPALRRGRPDARAGSSTCGASSSADGRRTPRCGRTARAEERARSSTFIDLVAERRAKHPDLHIYHYAPYETTALKRLAMRYPTHGEGARRPAARRRCSSTSTPIVRGAVRVSAPSYSIKKLEPLYMGDELRDEDDVARRATPRSSRYHESATCATTEPRRRAGACSTTSPTTTEYDCVSTLRLRDWLLDRAEEAGVRDLIVAAGQGRRRARSPPTRTRSFARAAGAGPGPTSAPKRTAEEQAYAMLATAIDYYPRERKSSGGTHFVRLRTRSTTGRTTRDVFVVESRRASSRTGPSPRAGRRTRDGCSTDGDWAAGQQARHRQRARSSTPTPRPAGCRRARRRAVRRTPTRRRRSTPTNDPRRVLARREPPSRRDLRRAPGRAGARRRRRATDEHRGRDQEVVGRRRRRARARRDRRPRHAGAPRHRGSAAAACCLDRRIDRRRRRRGARRPWTTRYVAVQGPPGTGKTYVGSHVIAELVESTAGGSASSPSRTPSSRTCSAGIVEAGLDPALVGKSANDAERPPHLHRLAKNGVRRVPRRARRHRLRGRRHRLGLRQRRPRSRAAASTCS